MQSSFLAEQSKHYFKIELPILSIFASEDHVVPATDHHDKLIEDIALIKPVEILGAGHVPHHTRMNEVISAIEEFVDELN